MGLEFAYRTRGLRIGLVGFKPRDQNPERAKEKEDRKSKQVKTKKQSENDNNNNDNKHLKKKQILSKDLASVSLYLTQFYRNPIASEKTFLTAPETCIIRQVTDYINIE